MQQLVAGTSLDVSSDISTATEASSLDCHFCGVDSPPACKNSWKQSVTRTHTHTHTLSRFAALWRKNLNRHLKSLRKE